MRYNDNYDYDDFDIEDRHSYSKNRNRKVRRKKQRDSASTKVFGVMITITVLLLIGIFLLFATRYLKDYLVEPLYRSIDEYEAFLKDYDSMEGEYLEVLEKAEKISEGYNFIAYYTIQNEMDEKVAYLKTYKGGQKVISDLKAEYLEHYKNYRVTDTYRKAYDDLMDRIDIAIADNDQSQLSVLRKELKSLEQNLRIENENLVQSGKNEINHLGLSSANPEDNVTMRTYQTQVDEYVAEGNYAAALDILDEWKMLAGVTAERIAESESKAKELFESNRENHATDEEYFKAGYIFENSDKKELTREEVMELSRWSRKIAMYEIYARHHCLFPDNTVQSYFNQQYWYYGVTELADFNEWELNEYEAANIKLLKELN